MLNTNDLTINTIYVTVHAERWVSRQNLIRDIGSDGTYRKFWRSSLKMFSRDPRVQLASLQPRETFALGVRALGSQPLRSIAMFTQCRIHAPFTLRECRRCLSYALPCLEKPLGLLEALPLWLWGRFEVGRHASRFSTKIAFLMNVFPGGPVIKTAISQQQWQSASNLLRRFPRRCNFIL